MTLTDAVAIITGGRRIGRVVARELALRGADLVLSYRGSKTEAEDTAAISGPNASKPCVCDS